MSPKNRRSSPEVGDVIQIELPSERYAYGRVLRDAGIAVYREVTSEQGKPPIGSRDFQFIVGIYTDVLKKCPVVGRDPSQTPDEDWPPPYVIRDPTSHEVSIYYRGVITPSTESETQGLEVAAVWDLHHVVDRIVNGNDSIWLRDGTSPPRR